MPDVTCPHCKQRPLKAEGVVGMAPEPEADVDGCYFPGLGRDDVVYCDDCGEVTATEAYDHIHGGAWCD